MQIKSLESLRFLLRNTTVKHPVIKSPYEVEADGGALRLLKRADTPLIKFPLQMRRQLNHDTFLLRFALPKQDMTLGLALGTHIILSATFPTYDHPEGELVARKYTPVSTLHDKGHFDLLIKSYRKGQHPKFPHGGKFSQYLELLKIGDMIDVEGPKGKLIYKGEGLIHIKGLNETKVLRKHQIGMIGGGTGIAPLFQLIQCSLQHHDPVDISLIFGNKSEADMILREELENYANENSDKFKVHFIIDQATPEWKYGTGFVTKEMIQQHLPAPGEDTIILYCGPPLMNQLIRDSLKELGYSNDMMYKF